MRVGFEDALAFFRDREVPLWSRLLGLVALAYVLSPVDFVPDAVPLLGWLDDAGVIAAVAAWYARRIGEYHDRRRSLPPPRD